jgi:hypothetical protein
LIAPKIPTDNNTPFIGRRELKTTANKKGKKESNAEIKINNKRERTV